MRVFLVVPLLLAIAVASPIAQDQAAKSPENASYSLDATLDPVNKVIQAEGTITWRNVTRTPATELRLHMYWNAWRTSSSTWMRENALSGGDAQARSASDPALIDLTRLTLPGPGNGVDLLRNAHFVAPDTGNAADQTLLVVPLPVAVQPGETIVLDIEWNAHVPRTYDRTGVLGSNFFIAQWFPKVAVFEDTDGPVSREARLAPTEAIVGAGPGRPAALAPTEITVGAGRARPAAQWNAHEFHLATEFFADFGRYDVRLTVPSGWVVGATGREQRTTNRGNGTTTHEYVARDVHDFAWTTSPDFIDLHSRFDEPGLPSVDLRLLLQRGHRPQAERHFEAARAALKWFGKWYGPYPYGQLTIVDPVAIVNPAAQGGDTSGMEYPTLISAGTDWTEPWNANAPEDVVIHEVGHQLWYGIVATNEVEHAWMDEGIDTYASARVMATAYPNRFVAVGRYFGGLVAWPYADVPWSREVDGDYLNSYRAWSGDDVPARPAWQLSPADESAISYDRTALWLTTLERLVGEDVMQRILATHFTRGAYRHPGPDEFFAIVNEVSGRDLTWFFDTVYRQPGTFDYAVDDVTTIETDRAAFDNVVRVRRLGSGSFPVDVRVTFDDGDSITESWDGKDPSRTFKLRRATRIATVEIDPNHVLALDAHQTNNTWTSQPATAKARDKWAVRWFTWYQHVLLNYAFFC